MRKVSVMMMAALIGLAACNSEKETPAGQKYKLVRKGDGVKGKPGEYLVMEMLFKDGKDSVWNDTKKNDLPVVMQVFDSAQLITADGVMQVLQSLTKGDSAVFAVSAKNLFEKTWGQAVPPEVDSASLFTFHVSLTKILTEQDFPAFRDEYQAKQMAKMEKEKEEQRTKDNQLLDDYLAQKKIQAVTTPSGLRYVITQAGKGPTATDGDEASIHYAGFNLRGECFDTSIEAVAKEQGRYDSARAYNPYKLVVGSSPLIEGWQEALKLMNKGSKMTVYIPSGLAYGPQRRSAEIGENEILMFDMEMVDLKPAKR